MKAETVLEGNELLKLIDRTKKMVEDLTEMKPGDREKQRIHDDGMYNFAISEYKDGSGISANCARYFGNEMLHEVILNEVKRQLAMFEKMLDELK